MAKDSSEVICQALAYMEAALNLLDSCKPPVGAAEYLDLAIHRLAEATGQSRTISLLEADWYADTIAQNEIAGPAAAK